MQKSSLSFQAISQLALCCRGRHCLPRMLPAHKGTGQAVPPFKTSRTVRDPWRTVSLRGNVEFSFSGSCITNKHSSPMSSFLCKSQLKTQNLISSRMCVSHFLLWSTATANLVTIHIRDCWTASAGRNRLWLKQFL